MGGLHQIDSIRVEPLSPPKRRSVQGGKVLWINLLKLCVFAVENAPWLRGDGNQKKK